MQKRLVWALSLVLVSWTAIATAADLRTDAVAIWDFSAGSGAVLRDVSGNGHDGRIFGARWVSGSWGRGLEFERAKRNFVMVPDAAELHVQPPLSLIHI